jgi:hypothetical protein
LRFLPLLVTQLTWLSGWDAVMAGRGGAIVSLRWRRRADLDNRDVAGGFGEGVGVRAAGDAGLDEHRGASRDLARIRAHDLLFQLAVGDLGERDGLVPAPPGELGVPGGPDVAGPVGIRPPGHHVLTAADRQRRDRS